MALKKKKGKNKEKSNYFREAGDKGDGYETSHMLRMKEIKGPYYTRAEISTNHLIIPTHEVRSGCTSLLSYHSQHSSVHRVCLYFTRDEENLVYYRKVENPYRI